MNDRELLENAAKAAGVVVHTIEDADGVLHWDGWNPLTDDGDALRLAVKLRIDVFYGAVSVVAELQGNPKRGMQLSCLDDPYAATRRAIVRAAAEIGRSMA